MLIAEIRRKITEIEDIDPDAPDSAAQLRNLLSGSKEDLLTADVFGALKYLPRRPYLEAALRGIAQRNKEFDAFAQIVGSTAMGEDDYQFIFWPRHRNPGDIEGEITEPDVEVLAPGLRIFVEAKLGAGFGKHQIARQLLIGLTQQDHRKFFLVHADWPHFTALAGSSLSPRRDGQCSESFDPRGLLASRGSHAY